MTESELLATIRTALSLSPDSIIVLHTISDGTATTIHDTDDSSLLITIDSLYSSLIGDTYDDDELDAELNAFNEDPEDEDDEDTYGGFDASTLPFANDDSYTRTH